jgi:hypothetical protein
VKPYILAIFTLGLALRIGYALLLTPAQQPDEDAHLHYISICDTGSLPTSCGRCVDQGSDYENQQPPLYYVWASCWGYTFGRSLFSYRMLSVWMWVISFWIMALMFDREKWADISLALFAFAPTLVALNASVNNLNLAIMFAAIAMFCHRELYGLSRSVMLGLFCGLAIWAKLSALPLLLMLVLSGSWVSLAIAGTMVGALFGWNYVHWGDWTATVLSNAGSPAWDSAIGGLSKCWRGVEDTIWVGLGRQGDCRFAANAWIFGSYAAICGLFLWGFRSFTSRSILRHWLINAEFILLLSTFALSVAFAYATHTPACGRYLWTMAVPLCWMFGQGLWLQFGDRVNKPVVIAMATLSVITFIINSG